MGTLAMGVPHELSTPLGVIAVTTARLVGDFCAKLCGSDPLLMFAPFTRMCTIPVRTGRYALNIPNQRVT